MPSTTSRSIGDISHRSLRSNAAVQVEPPRKRGPKPRPIVEFPTPLFTTWDDPDTFCEALELHMRRHGDSCRHLHKVIAHAGGSIDRMTLHVWRRGKKSPRDIASLDVLARIERRYGLAEGYFKAKLPRQGRAARGHKLPGVAASERRRLAWHLPDDFDRRPVAERDAILEWVRTVVISGATDFRRFQAEALKHRYAVRFPDFFSANATKKPASTDDDEDDQEDIDAELLCGAVDAPPRLTGEMGSLIAFKTATLTEIGFQRNGVWGEETSAQKIEHLGLMFGALAASPRGAVSRYGAPLSSLTFAMLIFPKVWDWYVQWRERRRGFYTRWEVEMLRLGLALTRVETGWLRQNPLLGERLRPIPGLVSTEDIDAVNSDWPAACDAFYRH
ncbi:MAG: hypothetical protein JWR80_3325 [Bradyrhizobium sp.]|nr:hypothetical protein [Bradyrhizobium sp.]